jgi:hypothetical protein
LVWSATSRITRTDDRRDLVGQGFELLDFACRRLHRRRGVLRVADQRRDHRLACYRRLVGLHGRGANLGRVVRHVADADRHLLDRGGHRRGGLGLGFGGLGDLGGGRRQFAAGAGDIVGAVLQGAGDLAQALLHALAGRQHRAELVVPLDRDGAGKITLGDAGGRLLGGGERPQDGADQPQRERCQRRRGQCGDDDDAVDRRAARVVEVPVGLARLGRHRLRDDRQPLADRPRGGVDFAVEGAEVGGDLVLFGEHRQQPLTEERHQRLDRFRGRRQVGLFGIGVGGGRQLAEIGARFGLEGVEVAPRLCQVAIDDRVGDHLVELRAEPGRLGGGGLGLGALEDLVLQVGQAGHRTHRDHQQQDQRRERDS